MDIPSNPQLFTQPTVAIAATARSKEDKAQDLEQACQDFEAIFLFSLFKEMRSTVVDGGLFEKSNDQEIFQEMMDMEAAKAAASQNTLGLGQALLRQLQDPPK